MTPAEKIEEEINLLHPDNDFNPQMIGDRIHNLGRMAMILKKLHSALSYKLEYANNPYEAMTMLGELDREDVISNETLITVVEALNSLSINHRLYWHPETKESIITEEDLKL